jgi:hypothetical protein
MIPLVRSTTAAQDCRPNAKSSVRAASESSESATASTSDRAARMSPESAGSFTRAEDWRAGSPMCGRPAVAELPTNLNRPADSLSSSTTRCSPSACSRTSTVSTSIRSAEDTMWIGWTGSGPSGTSGRRPSPMVPVRSPPTAAIPRLTPPPPRASRR